MDEIFSRLRNPDNLVTDNGPQFVSTEFTDFLCTKNVQHDRTAVYNPAENGLAEVVNRMWKYGAQAIFAEGIRFKNGMRNLVASFRSTPPENSKSPAELLRGWTMRSDSDIRNPSLFAQGERVLALSHQIFKLSLRERDEIVQEKFRKRKYGKSNETSHPRPQFEVGDFVRYKKPRSTVLKGMSPLSQPLRVVKVLGRYSFLLADGQKWNARRLSRYYLPMDWPDPEVELYPDPAPRPPAVLDPAVFPAAARVLPPRATRGIPPQRFDPCDH
ncbi:MAG: transposase family protein [Gammaproteobacteria bacterium]|nr:transposase family protein [Gammaproteobacteria bacterium]